MKMGYENFSMRVKMQTLPDDVSRVGSSREGAPSESKHRIVIHARSADDCDSVYLVGLQWGTAATASAGGSVTVLQWHCSS